MAAIVPKRVALLVAGGALLALAACGGATDSTAQLVNPASANCVAQGGSLVIETAGDGGQYGVCLFDDNRQCEEWALLRGACPAGGIKVTGYVTPQARYCAIKGGAYVVAREQTDATPDEGSCALPGQTACDALQLYEGRCAE